MKLIYELPIQSSGLLLLTKVKKGDAHLIDAMSQRIARLTTRINRGELFARVDLVELQLALSSLEASLQQRKKEYQALIQAQGVNAEAIRYKTLKILPCHVGTPTHSIWISSS